jgi:hypothetical protein
LLAQIEAKGIALGVLVLQVQLAADGTPRVIPSVLGGGLMLRRQRWWPKGFGRYCWDMLSESQRQEATRMAGTDKSRLWPWLADELIDEQLQVLADRLSAAIARQHSDVDAILHLAASGQPLDESHLAVLRAESEAHLRVLSAVNHQSGANHG